MPTVWQVPPGAGSGDRPEALALRAVERAAARLTEYRDVFRRGMLEVGERAFCQVGGDPAQPQFSAFSGVRLADREHHVFARGLGSPRDQLAGVSEVAIVTGVCLFTDRALTFVGEQGERFGLKDVRYGRIRCRVNRIDASPRLTLYELETAARLGRFIADLAVALAPGVRIGVTLDVPRAQYYCYLFGLYEAGLVDGEQMLSWFELVDQRRQRVLTAFRDALPEVAIAESASLDVLLPDIRSGVGSGRLPDPHELAARLAEADPLWRQVLEIEMPKSPVDLGYLSYAVELLRCGLSPARVGIAVDNRMEERIYNRARRLARALRTRDRTLSARMLALYPLEMVHAEGFDSGLYTNDPGDCFVDAAGRTHSPAELVEAAYAAPMQPSSRLRANGSCRSSPPARAGRRR